MPLYFFHFSDGKQVQPSDSGLEYANLEQAYLAACAAIPDIARDLLVKRMDPLSASFRIANGLGQTLMTVPFTEILRSKEWQTAKARRRPYGGPRSEKARTALALKTFRLMFDGANAGCVLLTPDMHIVEMNDFGARHSHVDAEAIRGLSIFDIFDLHGEARSDFTKFMSLAQAGVASQVIDLPYLVQDAQGLTVDGWWNARTWPIFDDDKNLLGFVEWAEPYTNPTHGGATKVSVSVR